MKIGNLNRDHQFRIHLINERNKQATLNINTELNNA